MESGETGCFGANLAFAQIIGLTVFRAGKDCIYLTSEATWVMRSRRHQPDWSFKVSSTPAHL